MTKMGLMCFCSGMISLDPLDKSDASEHTCYLQCPIYCDDKSDVISWQPNGCEHYNHGDQPSLWYPCCSDTGCSGCDTGDLGSWCDNRDKT